MDALESAAPRWPRVSERRCVFDAALGCVAVRRVEASWADLALPWVVVRGALFAAPARFAGALRDIAFDAAFFCAPARFVETDAAVVRVVPFLAAVLFVADFFIADFLVATPRDADPRFVDGPRNAGARFPADVAVFDFADVRADFVRAFVVAIVILRLRVDGARRCGYVSSKCWLYVD